ncbi:MAG: hypothetical protein IPP15_17310 [Saprospiraceae bacterium]|uniref:Uncharacterized protein n=1 Tax=Candidatus Opimibacter skivensis TaxID=2982028 RepID=A0A9D7XP43_9BACT|nr:hypothetical protein [Candidatus Opimibacter skivensis]
MKKAIAFLLFILLTKFRSRTVSEFLRRWLRWVITTMETSEIGQYFVHSSDEQDIIHGDTVIDGLTYFKLYRTFTTRQLST